MFGLFKSEKTKTKDRLQSYTFPLGFSSKLSSKTGWNALRVNSAIQEYLKFCYLAKFYGPVTPSKVVDDVWHLHLEYEYDYQDFCRNYLKMNLVHTPGNGSDEDDQKHRKQYDETRNAYQSEFGVIDSGIWGHSDTNTTVESSFGGGTFGGSGAGSDWGGSDSGNTGGDSGGHSSCSSSSCSSSCGSGCGGGD